MNPGLDTDVVIAGAGIAGSVLAFAMGKAGFRVLLVEPGQHDEGRPGGEVLQPRGVAALRQLGLLEAVAAAGARPLGGFHIWDETAGDIRLDYASVGAERGLTVEHGRLRAALWSAAASLSTVEVLRGKRVVDFVQRPGGILAELSGRTSVRAALLVGADGARSPLRARAGIASRVRPPARLSIATVPAQMLPSSDLGHLFVSSAGIAFAYTLDENRARLLIDPAAVDPGRPSPVQVAGWQACAVPWPQPDAVLQPGASGSHRYTAGPVEVERTHRGRLVLIGDAAGACHPLTASGMTSAILDGIDLAEAWARMPDAPQRALARYAAGSRGRQLSRRVLAGFMREICASPAPACLALRRAIFHDWRRVGGEASSIALLSMAADSPRALAKVMLRTVLHGLPRRGAYPPMLGASGRWRTAWGAIGIAMRHGVRLLNGTAVFRCLHCRV